MKEFCELRVLDEHAHLLFSASEGKILGSGTVRRIVLDTADPRYQEIDRVDREIRRLKDSFFFAGWDLERTYTKKEMDAADMFHLRSFWTFEPAGEECGTEYDDASACPLCHSGARQTTPLFMPLGSIPKSKDFCRTIGGEIILSRKAVKCFDAANVTGAKFVPLRSKTKPHAESPDWFQLNVLNSQAAIIPPTCTGNKPFDYDEQNEHRCERGDLIGLNLLSEVTISAASSGTADFQCSRQFLGLRRGLLRPERVILVSQKVRKIIETHKLKGCRLEVAYLQ
jgi:hypothetical protein